MKKFYIILIALLIVGGSVAAQSCLPEGITFSTQADINNFQTNYPNCTHIEGGVIISGSDITNLDGLSVVTSIGGGLSIGKRHHSGNLTLTSLTGLENITYIGSSLEIYHNQILTSLTGLEGITSIGDDLYIENNDALTSLTGLDNLTFIGGALSIDHNDSLNNLTGLEGLPSIWGYLSIDGNAALTSLTGLEGLTSIGGSLQIGSFWGGGNYALTSLTGLDNINAATINNLYIRSNHSLSTCAVQSICNYLASPNGEVTISNNATGCNSEVEVDSACVYLSNGEITLEPAFSFFPNPASTTITISTPTTSQKNTFMTLYSANGMQLLSRQITEQETVVDLSGLPQGIYFVRVSNDRTVKVGKFVKQ